MQRNPFSLPVIIVFFLHLSVFGQQTFPTGPNTWLAINEKSKDDIHTGSADFALERRFEILDRKTPLDIYLNDEVRSQITIFQTRRRGDIELALERSRLYFPLIEQMLDKYDLPLELKYLAVIESGLNPTARSRSGAVGLWQFLYTTCDLFDLEVDSYIDERCDPYKATEAACKYLGYLYRTYNDWNLVMASYNGGPGEVRKAIQRSGGKTDYWEIRPWLSEQAKNYVPSFIAVCYLMTYYQAYGFNPENPPFSFEETDTLILNYGVSFQQIASILTISVRELSLLNPAYKRQYIPEREGGCLLILPRKLIPEYLKFEQKILSCIIPRTDYHILVANAGSTADRNKIIHVVRQGDYCHKIALNYDCTIENIKAWNHLTTTTLYPGQQLEIWVEGTLEEENIITADFLY